MWAINKLLNNYCHIILAIMNIKNLVIFFLTLILIGAIIFFLLGKIEKEKLQQINFSDDEVTLEPEMLVSTSTKEEVVIVEDKDKIDVVSKITEVLSFPSNDTDTSDWKTYYTDSFLDDIKFQIKYPNDWIIESSGENQSGPNASLVLYDKRHGEGADNGIYMEVKKISVNEFVSNSPNKSDYEIIKINNTYGYVLKNSQGDFIATSVVLSNKNNSKIYTFYIGGPDLNNPSDPKSYLEVLEQILLSFKLVD